jgi:hypothetical protein
MRREIFAILLCVLIAPWARAQDAPRLPGPEDIYCSGTITSERIPRNTYIITGEQSNEEMTFQEGNYVYVNKGEDEGARKGDMLLVLRAVTNSANINWYRWQNIALHSLGTLWEDEGRLRVVTVLPHVSIAQIQQFCNYMQRGDIVVPFSIRPVPAIKSGANFDRFAAPSGRQVGLVVTGKSFQMSVGTGDVLYANLGSVQGIKTGNYLRLFRHRGTQRETAYQVWREAFRVESFGSVPLRWKWSTVPREILGEGVVLRVTPQTSTVLITHSLSEIYAGDYVELE